MECAKTESGVIWDSYYLNNSGTRSVIVERNFGRRFKKVMVRVSHLGKVYERRAIYFEPFGNFSSVTVFINGKRKSFCDYEILWK